MYEKQDFDQMPALADALKAAGCDDQRVLTHCRRKGGHVRGCWVVDQLLALEPEPKEDEYSWDWSWEHPTIKGDELKNKLQAFGTDSKLDEKLYDSTALALADWLEKKGDKTWAAFIRICCAHFAKSPGENYPDLVERYLELVECLQNGRPEFPDFFCSGGLGGYEDWSSDESDISVRGLPAILDAVPPGKGPRPVAQVIRGLDAVIRMTPIRGINFQEDYADQMQEILQSPAARHLRWLTFENRPEAGKTGPVIDALVKSPVTLNLDRLCIDGGLLSDPDALALAHTEFKRLRRLEFGYGGLNCSAKAADRLMTAPWFQRLEHLKSSFSKECCETAMQQLAKMPRVHTLALIGPLDRQILALSKTEKFPALRRLSISGADLTGEKGQVLCQLQAPKLLELWFAGSTAKTADIRALVTSPIFQKLRVLTFDGPRLDEAGLDALAGSDCAAKLRILRLHCGDSDLVGRFKSLADCALARPGAFPELTTLHITHPYNKDATRDLAKFLDRLSTPKLRHLVLTDCDFDDDCAHVLAENPTFTNLTFLKLNQGYQATGMLSPKAAKQMFHSANLQNLMLLELHNFALGNGIEFLADMSILPRLGSVAIWGSNARGASIDRIKKNRPFVHVGS